MRNAFSLIIPLVGSGVRKRELNAFPRSLGLQVFAKHQKIRPSFNNVTKLMSSTASSTHSLRYRSILLGQCLPGSRRMIFAFIGSERFCPFVFLFQHFSQAIKTLINRLLSPLFSSKNMAVIFSQTLFSTSHFGFSGAIYIPFVTSSPPMRMTSISRSFTMRSLHCDEELTIIGNEVSFKITNSSCDSVLSPENRERRKGADCETVNCSHYHPKGCGRSPLHCSRHSLLSRECRNSTCPPLPSSSLTFWSANSITFLFESFLFYPRKSEWPSLLEFGSTVVLTKCSDISTLHS